MKELKTIKDYTEALEKLGKEVASGTKLSALKSLHTRAVNVIDRARGAKSKFDTDRESESEAVKVVVAMPKFEGKQVVGILGSGHTRTHFHCKAKDGHTTITVHVPKTLFDQG